MSSIPHAEVTARVLPDDQLTITNLSEPVPHVRLQGTLDTINTPRFAAHMHGQVPTHRGWMVIDAAQLNMLTSSGTGALIELASHASSNGGLVMVVPPGNVRDVIGFMRLDLVIDTFETFESAIAFIDAQ